MLFDTDMYNSQESTCQIEIVFAWLTFSSIPIRIGTECYCFPTFKDLSRDLAHPFFQRECKSTCVVFLTQTFRCWIINIFENLGFENQFLAEELTPFFAGEGKDREENDSPLFKSLFFIGFRRTTAVFQQRAAKIGRNWLPAKKVWKVWGVWGVWELSI